MTWNPLVGNVAHDPLNACTQVQSHCYQERICTTYTVQLPELKSINEYRYASLKRPFIHPLVDVAEELTNNASRECLQIRKAHDPRSAMAGDKQ